MDFIFFIFQNIQLIRMNSVKKQSDVDVKNTFQVNGTSVIKEIDDLEKKLPKFVEKINSKLDSKTKSCHYDSLAESKIPCNVETNHEMISSDKINSFARKVLGQSDMSGLLEPISYDEFKFNRDINLQE